MKTQPDPAMDRAVEVIEAVFGRVIVLRADGKAGEWHRG